MSILVHVQLGLLLARIVRSVDGDLKSGTLVNGNKLAVGSVVCGLVALVLCYPLYTVWAYNFGNLSVPTRSGPGLLLFGIANTGSEHRQRMRTP